MVGQIFLSNLISFLLAKVESSQETRDCFLQLHLHSTSQTLLGKFLREKFFKTNYSFKTYCPFEVLL